MAEGTVKWKNPPEKLGKVSREDDASNDEYPYQIPDGLASPADDPEVDVKVTFNAGPGQTAHNVATKDTGGTGGGGG